MERVGALVKPNAIRVKRYEPIWETNAVFVPIGLVYGNLLVPGVAIKSREDLGLSERVDTVVHPEGWDMRP